MVRVEDTRTRQKLYKVLLTVLASGIDDSSGAVAGRNVPERQRLTQQYISAMVASGLRTDTAELRQALDWLVESSDPNDDSEESYYLCLHKIDAAIELGDHDSDFCRTAMQMLLGCRRGPLSYDLPATTRFKKLWAAKILLRHPDQRRYGSAARETLAAALRAAHASSDFLDQQRDASFLFRLTMDATPRRSLRSDEVNGLLRSLELGQRSGFFDIPRPDIEPIMNEATQAGITAARIVDVEEYVYRSIMSTAYVVDNLAPYTSRSSRVDRICEAACRALIGMFGRAPLDSISAFSKPYYRIMLAARVLIGLCAYHKEEPARLALPGLLRDNASSIISPTVTAMHEEKEALREVLKEWIDVDWDANNPEQHHKLGGGYSGAALIRIRPRLIVPSDAPGGRVEVPVHAIESVVIKYGSRANLARERRNWETIPPEYRNLFAAVPGPVYTSVSSRGEVIEYMVMEDLRGFRTLQELLPEYSDRDRRLLISRLVDHLRQVYVMDPSTDDPTGLIREIYLRPIIDSTYNIVSYLDRLGERDLDRSILGATLASLERRLPDLEKFPVSAMHGDLNLRNVMVVRDGADMRFKFIDLDHFTRKGDLAYDLGELVTDAIRFEQRRARKRVRMFAAEVEPAFRTAIADGRGDPSFEARLKLAKARSTIRLAELRTKYKFPLADSAISLERSGDRIRAEVTSLVEAGLAMISDVAEELIV